MKIFKELRLSKEEEEFLFDSSEVINCMLVTYQDDNSEVPTATLTVEKKNAIRRLTFGRMLKDITSLVPKDIVVENTDESLNLELIRASNNIAVKNRRGAGNRIFMNWETYCSLPSGLKYLLERKDTRYDTEITKHMKDGLILVGYVPKPRDYLKAPLDRPMHAFKNGLLWNYIYAPAMVANNFAVLKIL